MTDKTKYYIVEYSALPEVFLKVVEAKKLIESQQALTVQEAVDMVGISRSSFYKYKDTISPFYEYSRGKTITLALKLDDEPGVLSKVLNNIAGSRCNILTIHQSIPINGIADLTISIELVGTSEDMSEILSTLGELKGVHKIKIIARE
ncbi:ACT domain-containing protein [Vallitalea okinawensis]|uniref:ACT domain-containing protein n=1 Tax=Vallitalea okinawensis TaxID=2078660 RepID=UPI000CFB5DA0|nr:ACT domain-containing protein [Vallitalea okinawensis]